MSLKFVDGKSNVTCTCCKAKTDVEAKDVIAERRFDHVYDLLVASARTQGYNDGYLCRNCAKVKGIRYDLVDKIAKNHFTRAYFEARRDVKVVVNGE
jgi:hypothetical protein